MKSKTIYAVVASLLLACIFFSCKKDMMPSVVSNLQKAGS